MAKYTLSDIFIGDFPVTQLYGARPEYYTQYGFQGHEGVDWGTPLGTPIIAPFDGQIIRDEDDPKQGAYGELIVLWDKTQRCAVWFCHLDENYFQVGDEVIKGTILGKTGNSGNSTGSHVHVNFVETDVNANRLNQDNGYKGFLNILDPALVKWELGSPELASSGTGGIIETMPEYFTGLLQEQKLNLSNESQIRTFFQQAIEYPHIKQDLENATSANEVQADQLKALWKELKIEQETNNQLSLQLQKLQKELQDLSTTSQNAPNSVASLSGWTLLRLLAKKILHSYR